MGDEEEVCGGTNVAPRACLAVPVDGQGANGQGAENFSKFKDLFNYFDAFYLF
jgi:hypothetical protein